MYIEHHNIAEIQLKVGDKHQSINGYGSVIIIIVVGIDFKNSNLDPYWNKRTKSTKLVFFAFVYVELLFTNQFWFTSSLSFRHFEYARLETGRFMLLGMASVRASTQFSEQ